MEARQAIIDRFAGDNFTCAPVNIAFALIGWLYAEGFTRQMPGVWQHAPRQRLPEHDHHQSCGYG